MELKRSVTFLLTLAMLVILALGFVRLWPHANIFGTKKINTYEFLGGCWQGDVRVCDYDPFE